MNFKNNYLPIMSAIISRNVNILIYLLNNGYYHENNLISIAIYHNNIDVIKYLLNNNHKFRESLFWHDTTQDIKDLLKEYKHLMI